MPRQDLACDGVVLPEIPVLDVLPRQLILLGHLVSVWAVRAAIAITLGVERTYMWPIALIVRLRPRQLLQHLPARRRRSTVIQLILASSKLLHTYASRYA
jgi:hypothetical protein